MRRIVIAVLLLICATLMVSVSQAQLTNTKIAFESQRDGNSEIYVMDADGTNQENLTNNPANDYEPDWSPDGTMIAFTSDRDGDWEIYVMNADGTNPINLTNNPARDNQPSWSSDGTKIAFTSERGGSGDTAKEIYVMDAADGANPTRLTNNAVLDSGPDWSPDGTQIVFDTKRDGETNVEIYEMNADGTAQTRLTNNTANDQGPIFSPDSTQIVFISNREGNEEIYKMDADGTNQTRLTSNSADEGRPFWSPDGTMIAFNSYRNGPTSEIYVMNADGTNPIRLTNNGAQDVSASWSPFLSAKKPKKDIAQQFMDFMKNNDGNSFDIVSKTTVLFDIVSKTTVLRFPLTLRVNSQITSPTSINLFDPTPRTVSVTPLNRNTIEFNSVQPPTIVARVFLTTMTTNKIQTVLHFKAAKVTIGARTLNVKGGKIIFSQSTDITLLGSSGFASPFTIQQLTNNSTHDVGPSLYNGTIAWYGNDGTSLNDNEIFYWDGSTITQVTDNSRPDLFPSLYNGTIAWQAFDGNSDNEIFYWDGSTITQVTDNSTQDGAPSLYNGTIAWHGNDGTSLNDNEIFYWDGSTITQVTDNSRQDLFPSLYNGTIAWQAFDGNSDNEIFYWDGSTITQVTDNSRQDLFPSLYNGTIAWEAFDGIDREIFYWDGSTITQVTDNSRQDFLPSLYNGTIAWHGNDGTSLNDNEIFYWDGSTITQVTDNSTQDGAPSLYNGTIAWQAFDGNDSEIFYWDGNTITQVTDNSTNDGAPSLYDGTIAWQAFDGNDFEIFYATPTLAVTVSIDIKPGSFPNSINLKSKGVIPVAILNTNDFDDPTTVDGSTVRFGPGEAAPKHDGGHIEDVDNDGNLDWLGHFPTQDTGLSDADTEASITAQTLNGQEFTGTDSVTIVGGSGKGGKAPIAITAVRTETRVLPAFPSPANPEVWIPYHLSSANTVVLSIYDMQGRLVRELNIGHKSAGFYASKAKAAYWDGRNTRGENVASGVYFYTFKTSDFTATRKLLITR